MSGTQGAGVRGKRGEKEKPVLVQGREWRKRPGAHPGRLVSPVLLPLAILDPPSWCKSQKQEQRAEAGAGVGAEEGSGAGAGERAGAGAGRRWKTATASTKFIHKSIQTITRRLTQTMPTADTRSEEEESVNHVTTKNKTVKSGNISKMLKMSGGHFSRDAGLGQIWDNTQDTCLGSVQEILQ